MIKIFKNFIFDFDGTILNSNYYHQMAFQKVFVLKKIKKKFKYEKIKGLSTEQAFKKLGIKKNLKEFVELKRLIYRENLKKIKLYSNSKKTINFLKRKRKKIFIVSGSSRKNILFFLKKNNITCNGIISKENTKYSKPNPAPYKICLKKFKIKNKETVVIEDAFSGIKSAKDNKLTVIGLNNNKIKKKCDKYFNNFSSFYSFINKII